MEQPEQETQIKAKTNESSREEWAKELRIKFSKKDMIDKEGFLRTKYFYLQKLKAWTLEDEYSLINGIKQYGVGEWELIRRDYLSEWDVEEIRLKACRLLGIQDIDSYTGWTGDLEAIKKEFEKNKKQGMAQGLWSHNVLITKKMDD